MKRALITGVSSGIGHALAEEHLDRGWEVLGVSRRQPQDLIQRPGFRFDSLDVRGHVAVASVLGSLLEGVDRLDLTVLNAGVLGRFADLADVTLDELKETMEINLWANKSVLDAVFRHVRHVGQVVAMSSGASKNGNRGWAGYALSKAALNMLTKLYAAEKPDTHFCALAPGVIDTAMLEELLSRSPDERYPSVEAVRSKRHTPDVPGPDEAAKRLADVFERLPGLVPSGAFADVRKLPEE